MFIETPQVIEVTIYYRKSKSGNAVRVETDLSKIKEEDKKSFIPALFKLRPMTWKVYNELLRESKVTNPMTLADETDWTTYREKKLVKLLVSWDATDADGKVIPVTQDRIMSLHPLIAENILNEYDKKVYLDEEEQKN
jgi:hypothetical protein